MNGRQRFEIYMNMNECEKQLSKQKFSDVLKSSTTIMQREILFINSYEAMLCFV